MVLLATEGGAKLHAVCVPCPAQGHISPMFKLAKLLHSKGFHITFVNTEYNHRRMLQTHGLEALDGIQHFRFATIPDGLPYSDADATQDVPTLAHAIMNYFLEPFKKLLLRLTDPSADSPPVTFILSDVIMPFTLDAAQQLGGIPLVWLWTASACGFLGYLQYELLVNMGVVPFEDSKYLTDGSLDMVIDWVPSMADLRLKHLPSFIRITNKDDTMFNFMKISAETTAQSSAPVLFNTFDELENEVLKEVSKLKVGSMYTIGPLQLQLKNVSEDIAIKSLGSNLWKEDPQCLQWLDSRKPKSVVYVSFGSITTMTNDNLIEFAFGLANSNHPFLWTIRPDLVSGDAAVIPAEFLEETKDRGLLTTWCDQEAVLNHPSVAAFLTHSGWNSTLDTICSGVPVLCWPFFAEQQTNCWFSSEKWGIGMEIDHNVKRAEVEKQVRELMEGEKGKEMTSKTMEWKRLAEEATRPGTGLSFLNFDKFINEVILPLKHTRKC